MCQSGKSGTVSSVDYEACKGLTPDGNAKRRKYRPEDELSSGISRLDAYTYDATYPIVDISNGVECLQVGEACVEDLTDLLLLPTLRQLRLRILRWEDTYSFSSTLSTTALLLILR